MILWPGVIRSSMPTGDPECIPYGVAYLSAVLDGGPDSLAARRAYSSLVLFVGFKCSTMTMGERHCIDYAWSRWVDDINKMAELY